MKTVKKEELMFADDLVVVTGYKEKLQQNLRIYQKELKKIKMRINNEKTKTTIIATRESKHKIEIEGQVLEQVKSYNYLGRIIEENGK